MNHRNHERDSLRWRAHDNQICNFPVWLLSLLVASLLVTRCSSSVYGDETASLRLADSDHTAVTTLLRKSPTAKDFLATRYIDPQPMPDLSAEERRYGYVIFKRHWMDLVFPNSIPRKNEKTRKLKTWLTPGEQEPATFCLRTLQAIQHLEVRTGPLVSATGARLAAPVVELVRCLPRTWQGEEWLYPDGPVGVMYMPSYLEHVRPTDVTANRTLQYWLTIKTQENTAPGTYRGRVSISARKTNTCTLDLQVDVLPVKLRQPVQTLGFWDFQRPYQGELGTLSTVYQTMHSHGMNTVFTRGGLYEYEPQTDTYDFSKTISIDAVGRVTVRLQDSDLARCLEAARLAGFRQVIYTPHLQFLIARETVARYDKATLTQQIRAETTAIASRFQNSPHYALIKREIAHSGDVHYPMYSQAYADLYVAVVRAIREEVQRRNWPPLVLSTIDEAYSHHVQRRTAFPFVLRHLELAHLAGATTILNHCSPFQGGEYGAYIRAAMQHLDIAMPGGRLSLERQHTSPYNATLEQLVAAFTAENITTYNYSLSGQAGGAFPDLSVVRFANGFFFHTLGSGVQGNIDYIFFRPEGDPYNPMDDFKPQDNNQLWSHERLWFFPPQRRTNRLGGRALSLAAKREGIDDLRYLNTLTACLAVAQDTTTNPAVTTAAHSAHKTLREILSSCQFSDQSLDSNRRNLWSRWDSLDVRPNQPPQVAGQLRLRIGWDYAQYDRHRRQLALQILQLQNISDTTDSTGSP
ncbi:MAG: hypothetical protein VX346_12090 [Planctomycetota bacterium]|nr:hypothetical protein [Planctomycetota bacterium]